MNAWFFLFALLLTVVTAAYFIWDEMKVGFPFSWSKTTLALFFIFPWYVGALAVMVKGWLLISAGWMLAR
jgi:hypothetical protein